VKIVYSWLGEFVTLPALEMPTDGQAFETLNRAKVEALADAFNALGMVVEGIEYVDPQLERVVVARVASIEEIPDAEHIRKVMVEADEAELLQIVCGAWNFTVGDKVPLAKVGAVLPGDFAIGARKMLGVKSNGMLCSAKELALSDDAAGLLLLDPAAEVGRPVAETLGIFPDVVFDLAIEANRPDANCVIGVARDVAPRIGARFSLAHLEETVLPAAASASSLRAATVASASDCDLLTLVRMRGPFALKDAVRIQRRLTLCGMRSISPIVDASNYAMLELGQPTHPYAIDRLEGRTIGVRRARPNETLVTLDQVERTLLAPGEDLEGDIVIVDGEDHPVGLAGVMGGASSEIEDDTSEVLVELAHFPRAAIARTSKRLGLRSEASMRFERGVDPRIHGLVAARIASLTGATITESYQVGEESGTTQLSLRLAEIRRILGVALSVEEVTSLLHPIGFEVVDHDEMAVTLKVPSFRPDCQTEIDLIEEVARHYGYERFDKRQVRSPYVGLLTESQRREREIRRVLVGAGLYETLGATLVSASEGAELGIPSDPIFAANPLSAEESCLRMTLLGGLLRAVRFNVGRREWEFGLFELGSVMARTAEDPGSLPNERRRIGIAIVGGENPSALAIHIVRALQRALRIDALSIEDCDEVLSHALGSLGEFPVLHQFRNGVLTAGERPIGVVGEVSREVTERVTDGMASVRIGYAECDLLGLLDAPRQSEHARTLSSHTSSDLDLAFEVADAVRAIDLVTTVASAAGELCQGAFIFDEFRSERLGAERKSLGVRIRLESLDGTVSEQLVAEIIARASLAVAERFGGTLRANESFE
jgi:phenylalanyl-tRNA synthetase beta chain